MLAGLVIWIIFILDLSHQKGRTVTETNTSQEHEYDV